jgi:hypothetical protein
MKLFSQEYQEKKEKQEKSKSSCFTYEEIVHILKQTIENEKNNQMSA